MQNVLAPIESSATYFNLKGSIIAPTYIKTMAEVVWHTLYAQTLHQLW